MVELLVPEAVRQALEEGSIDPIENPDVEVLELERGRPARLKATVSVMPEVQLGDASALDAPTPSIEVTDEMVERRLEDLRQPMAEITPVEREARLGDVAIIDVEVDVDGTVVESETRKAMEADLREGVLLPELLEVLPGTFVGETRSATVKFPDDYCGATARRQGRDHQGHPAGRQGKGPAGTGRRSCQAAEQRAAGKC